MTVSSPMFERPQRRWRFTHVVIGCVIMAAGSFWAVQAFRHGSLIGDTSATRIIQSQPHNGQRDVALGSEIWTNVTAGRTIDPTSLDGSVFLFRANDHRLIQGLPRAAPGNGGVIFKPNEDLEPLTRYSFEVRGIKDGSGEEIPAFTVVFTTAAAGGPSATATELQP